MSVYLIGADARLHSVEQREQLLVHEKERLDRSQCLLNEGAIEEIVSLVTCNRIEYYLYTHKDVHELIPRLFPNIQKHLNVLEGHSVAKHLFRVSSGLESQVLGENEILGQVKQAYSTAYTHGHTGKHLNILFQRALSVGKKVRTQTYLSKHAISTGGIILNIIKEHFQNYVDCKVLLVGTGTIARSVALALVKKGIHNVLVSGRDPHKREIFARETHTHSVSASDIYAHLHDSHIIISSTSSQGHIFTEEHKEFFGGTRKLLFDLAVPRDIDPRIALQSHITLFNIDSIKSTLYENKRKRTNEIKHAEKIIESAHSYYSLATKQQVEQR